MRKATTVALLMFCCSTTEASGPLLAHHAVAPAAPVFSVGIVGDGMSSDERKVLELSPGVAIYPMDGKIVVPRVVLGVDVDFRKKKDNGGNYSSAVTDWVPVARAGIAILAQANPKRPSPFARALLPWLTVYSLLGVRIPSDDEGTAIRAGIGISSPLLVVIPLKAGAPIPNMVEAFAEVDLRDARTSWYVKLGVGI